ncbi:unnamed protein product [Darwinula stevensoni]|uniref:CCDC92/74 N-terminal domain-containing protein n=1 Tax=Darwinula stevensoni TaxID=69355 RepID=A0A7R9AA46_9CRUS|nr:unnamed protein product [Darwinula stevensoni]CAG0897911.1 unnamed protein product [Darwinula stevensoni]
MDLTQPASSRGKEEVIKVDLPRPEAIDPHQRVVQLERAIVYLQEQHAALLRGLQDEIEELKRRNKDLQTRLVFATGGTGWEEKPKDAERIKELQAELDKRQGELEDATSRNNYLQKLINDLKRYSS